jgi:hypothetical protein
MSGISVIYPTGLDKIFNHIGSVINRPKLERPRKKILSMSY